YGTDLRRGRTTRAPLVVGSVHDNFERRDVRSFLHWIPDCHRRWRMGKPDPGWLGVGHYQFRFLDRYRTRRNTHLRHSVFAPAKMAYVDQPFRGGDDAFCSYLRGDFPRCARGACVDGVVFGATP